MSSAGDHLAIKAALVTAGLDADFGPRSDLPTEGGRVAQAVVIYPTAPLHQHRRSSGGSSGRETTLTAVCVGPTVLDALNVADEVEAAIGGMRLPGKGGVLRQILATTPAPEPNADPVRVSLSLEYTTVTKG